MSDLETSVKTRDRAGDTTALFINNIVSHSVESIESKNVNTEHLIPTDRRRNVVCEARHNVGATTIVS